jgi:hypothetical protein
MTEYQDQGEMSQFFNVRTGSMSVMDRAIRNCDSAF